MKKEETIVVIGAGPAGLTAAYTLAKGGKRVIVLEGDSKYVGGISKTVNYKGFLFDIGGHRFFSKSQEVEDLWTEILPKDFMERPRSSRIYYKNQFFSYPLKPFEAFYKLGPWESIRCIFSYFKSRLLPIKDEESFQDWVSNRFGKRLFNIFFKTYTEKVWGMSCKDISADWAAQRIKGLSLWAAAKSALLPKKKNPKGGQIIKTLIDHFRYPRKGPGMLWEACAEKITDLGGKVLMGRRVEKIKWDATKKIWTVSFKKADGKKASVKGHHVIFSAALGNIGKMLGPKASPKLLKATSKLRYRDFLIVSLVLKEQNHFSDNWIYIHDPNVQVGRIQNFKSWSPEMVPDPSLCCYGLEYFCNESDSLWAKPDKELITLATRELCQIGLANPGDVIDGCVVRQRKAYPVYDAEYKEHVEVIRKELEKKFPNLHLVGRNGMHKYNNQDHAMMTALLSAENILRKKAAYDPWKVNSDAEYHETGEAGSEKSGTGVRQVPSEIQKKAA